jgi:hypothetical protein
MVEARILGVRPHIALSLILALACLGLAACGGGGGTSSEAMTTQQYEQFLKKVSQHENESQATIQEGLHAKSMDQLTKALSTFAADQEARAEELASVTPPKKAQSAHANLEKAFEDTAAAVNEVIPQIEQASSPQAVLAILGKATGAQKSGRELQAALAELSKLGYSNP